MVGGGDDYEFDVFLSVKDDEYFKPWVEESFLRLFTKYFRQDVAAECGRETIGIYYYKQNVATGDPWLGDLKSAIKRSRLAVTLCSPLYFLSEFCLMEFHSFLKRLDDKDARVLLPVSLHDLKRGKNAILDRVQCTDLSDYVNDSPTFDRSPMYLEFEKTMKDFSALVARRVKEAPPFEDWPVVEESTPTSPPPVKRSKL